MCELLALCFNKKIRPYISFRAFRESGEYNPHGWGIAFYPEPHVACIFKENLPVKESILADFISKYHGLRSKIFICHVRFGTSGGRYYRNTHPFSRELLGRDYVFAHNGTINYKGLRFVRFKPIGETDSERVFCYILDRISERGINSWGLDEFRWIHELFLEINSRGYLNCLLSDGEYLFCYSDMKGFNRMCYVYRAPPYPRVRLRDLDWEIDLNLTKSEDEKGYVIATYPLTNENWETFSDGELLILRDGEIIYRSHRPAKFRVSEIDLDILKIIRLSRHRVSLKIIMDKLSGKYSSDEIKHHVGLLLSHGYIRQDNRDVVRWDKPMATFYTNPRKRQYIDSLLGKSNY